MFDVEAGVRYVILDKTVKQSMSQPRARRPPGNG